MKEDLLHFIWQSKILLPLELYTVSGEPLHIIHAGSLNTDAGPDFFNARIRVGGTTWAGNVEMHLQSGMWNAHRHQHDKKYSNVVLHVVYHHDREILNEHGTKIPTLELRNYIPPLVMKKYELLQKNKSAIPCESIFAAPSSTLIVKWMERLLIERLEQKCMAVQDLLLRNNQHWDETFYQLTGRYFGMKTNAQAFELLTQQLPLHVLARNVRSRLQTEALVFGVAGFLEHLQTQDKYISQMQAEFRHLKEKYMLTPMDVNTWKFSRTRPANFPTMRLAQFAALIFRSSHLLSRVLEETDLKVMHRLYETDDNPRLNVNLFHPKCGTHRSSFALGRDSADLLLINSVLPVLFWYGKCHDKPSCCDRALRFYEQLRPENNAVSRYWKKMGLSASSAFDSQALLQMNTQYCNKLRCLSCAIGNELLLKSNE